MDTCVCPCMDWNKKTHKLWSFVSKCPCMDCSFLQNTTSVAIFWYSWYFCGYFVYMQPHKTDSHTGKKTPKFMDKSSHKTPFCGSGDTDTKPNSHTGKRHPNLWTKVATRHRFVGPSVRPSGEVSGHLPENAWREWPEILHADVSRPSWELKN